MEDNTIKIIGYWHGFYEDAYPDPLAKLKPIGLRGSFQYLTREEYGDD